MHPAFRRLHQYTVFTVHTPTQHALAAYLADPAPWRGEVLEAHAAVQATRNRRVGLALARGQTLDAVLAELGHVAEGVHSAREVQRLARECGAEVPITDAVCGVLFDGMSAAQAVQQLLSRDPRGEAP